MQSSAVGSSLTFLECDETTEPEPRDLDFYPDFVNNVR
jgi:hypothetical protein